MFKFLATTVLAAVASPTFAVALPLVAVGQATSTRMRLDIKTSDTASVLDTFARQADIHGYRNHQRPQVVRRHLCG